MEDLISIIVPVYNVKEYLPECLKSIINQTYRNLEIIVVDDGSTDGSSELCDQLALIDNRIFVYHKKNGGLSDARNYGIKKSNGIYIGFVDSDDYISKDMYKTLWNMCKKYNTDISCARFKIFGKKDYKKIPKDTMKEEILTWDVALNSVLQGVYSNNRFLTISVWDRLYKKDLLNGLEFPVGRNYEDIMFTTKIFERAQKVAYINKTLYYYRIRPGSITNNNNNYVNIFFKDNLAFRAEQIRYLDNHSKKESCLLARFCLLSDLFFIRRFPLGNLYDYYKKYVLEEIPNMWEILSAKISCIYKMKLIIKYFVVIKYVND